MPKKAAELSAIELQRLKTPGCWAVGGVNGLYLNVTETGARSWLLIFSFGGRRPEMGLGPFPDVPLAKARERAREARDLIRRGINPIDAARAKRSSAAAKIAAAKTFDQCADAFIKGQEPGWRNLKHGAQWRSTLSAYASPVIGNMLVQDIESAQVWQCCRNSGSRSMKQRLACARGSRTYSTTRSPADTAPARTQPG